MPSLKLSSAAATFLVVAFPLLGFSAEYRTWTIEGLPVEAVYRGHASQTVGGVKSESVKLQKRGDNAVVSVPLEKLAKADRNHVHALVEEARIRREQRRSERTPMDFEAKKKEMAAERAEQEKREAERKKRLADEKAKRDEERAAEKLEREKQQAERVKRLAEGQAEYEAEKARRDAEWEKSQAERETRWRSARISAKTEPRIWTDRDKKFQVEAQLIDFDAGTVQLKRKDNDKILSIALEKLSLADQDYVKKTTAEFTNEEPDFVEYAGPDGSFKGRIPVIRLSTAPAIQANDVPATWSAPPDPEVTPKGRKLDFKPKNLSFRFGKQEEIAEFEGIHFSDGAPEKILTGISLRGRKAGGSGTIFVGDTKTGSIRSRTYPVRSKIFGLSPDGTNVLVGHAAEDSDNIVYLSVVDTTRAQLPSIGVFQVWDRSKVAAVDEADWVDDKHFLVRAGSTLVLVRTENGTAVWSMRAHDVAALSPGKKYFIVRTSNGSLLAETATGQPIGRIVPSEGNNIRHASRLAFSPDGTRIAVLESLVPRGGLIHLVDLKAGVVEKPFYVDSDQGTNMFWIDDVHVLCCGHMTGGTLVDTVERIPVWIYSGCNWKTVFFAGRLWHTSGFGHNDVAFSIDNAEIPHSGLPKLSPMPDLQKYCVRPGLEVELAVDISIPDSGKLREHVTKILTDNGLKVVPKAPLKLAVRMTPQQQVEVTYQTMFAHMSRSDRSVGKATYTPYTYSVSFEERGRTLWTVRQNMLTPNISASELKDGKTIQDIVTEKTTPQSDWYFEVEIPSQIPFDHAGKSTLFP